MTGIDMFMKQNGIQTSTAAESPSSWEENSGKSALGWLADRTQPRQMTPSPPPKEEFNVVDLLRSSDRQPMPPNEPPPPTPPPPHDKPPTALSRSQSLHAYSDSAPHVMPMQHSNSVQNLFKINQKGESTPPQRSSPTSRGDPQQQQQQVVQQQVQQQVQQPMWILPGLNVGQMSSMVMPTFVQSLPVGIPQVQQVQASHIPTPPTEPPPPEPPVPPEAPPPPVPEPPTVPPPPQEAPPVEPVPPVSAIQKPTPPQQPQVQKPVPSQQPPQQLPRVEKPAEKPRPEPPAPRAPEPPMADVEPLAVFQVDPPPEQPAVSLSLARFGLATDKLARARCELSVRVGCFAIASNSLCEVEEIQSGRAVLRSIHGNYWMERPLSTVRPARLIVLNPANSLFSSPNSKSLKSFITFLRTSAAIATKSATDDFLADTVFKFDGEYASVWDSHPEWSETNTLFLEEAEDSVQGCLPNAVIIPPTQGFSKDEELFKELRGIIEKLLTTTEDTRSFIEDHVTGNWKQGSWPSKKVEDEPAGDEKGDDELLRIDSIEESFKVIPSEGHAPRVPTDSAIKFALSQLGLVYGNPNSVARKERATKLYCWMSDPKFSRSKEAEKSVSAIGEWVEEVSSKSRMWWSPNETATKTGKEKTLNDYPPLPPMPASSSSQNSSSYTRPMNKKRGKRGGKN